ncbi:MAG: hypothetical protein RRY35_04995 [Clostridiales bacterium]
MLNYRKMYLELFNAISDALSHMEQQNFGLAKTRLQQAQQFAEDQYINAPPQTEHENAAKQ